MAAIGGSTANDISLVVETERLCAPNSMSQAGVARLNELRGKRSNTPSVWCHPDVESDAQLWADTLARVLPRPPSQENVDFLLTSIIN